MNSKHQHNYRCKKERSVAFKIRQNAFPGLRQGPRWGSSRRSSSPAPLVAWEKDTLPIPYPARRFGSRGHYPQIFSSKTAPDWNKLSHPTDDQSRQYWNYALADPGLVFFFGGGHMGSANLSGSGDRALSGHQGQSPWSERRLNAFLHYHNLSSRSICPHWPLYVQGGPNIWHYFFVRLNFTKY